MSDFSDSFYVLFWILSLRPTFSGFMGEDEVLSVVEVRVVMFADVNLMRGPVELEVARGSAPKKRRRRKNVILLNLPWCNSVTTDIGRKLLRLVNYSLPSTMIIQFLNMGTGCYVF